MAGQPVPVLAGGANGSTPDLRVRLVAPLTLLSQAVSAALRSRGIDVEAVRLGASVRRDAVSSGILLLLDDLTTAADVRRVLAHVSSTDGPSLVLTAREGDRYWGALLAAGASVVMSSSALLDDVEATLRCLHNGEECIDPAERLRLVRAWNTSAREQHALADRLASLSPRERTVLDGLCGGSGVPDLAEELGVAETTVRSQVKAILRKLGVRSQLAAVAAVHRLASPLVAGTNSTERPRPEERQGDGD